MTPLLVKNYRCKR